MVGKETEERKRLETRRIWKEVEDAYELAIAEEFAEAGRTNGSIIKMQVWFMRRWLSRWFKRWKNVSTGPLAGVEEGIAERGGGWDGLQLGKWYKVYVVAVPETGELTLDGKPKVPVCRVKDDDGNFVGRYIVTEVNKPVKLGQELMVLLTTAHASVVFGTAE